MIRKNWSERRPLTSFTLKIAKRQRKPSINGFLKKLNQPHLKTGHWYRCSDKAVSWINGKMVRFEIAADITEKKLAEIELRELSEALKRSNQELEQFAYVASHDLQEPLRMISSYTQLLEKRYSDKLDQDAKDFINYAVDGANRMQKLIQDLLTYSRPPWLIFKPLQPLILIISIPSGNFPKSSASKFLAT
jgi:signal transduction histidine kinase